MFKVRSSIHPGALRRHPRPPHRTRPREAACTTLLLQLLHRRGAHPAPPERTPGHRAQVHSGVGCAQDDRQWPNPPSAMRGTYATRARRDGARHLDSVDTGNYRLRRLDALTNYLIAPTRPLPPSPPTGSKASLRWTLAALLREAARDRSLSRARTRPVTRLARLGMAGVTRLKTLAGLSQERGSQSSTMPRLLPLGRAPTMSFKISSS